MTTTCKCGRPTRDERFTCDECSDGLTKVLAEVPWLTEQIDIQKTGEKGVDYRTKGGVRGTERPMPYRPSIAEAATNLRAVMVSWVRFCLEESVRNQSPSQTVPEDDMGTISRWLMWRVDGLALLDIGPEAVDEITSALAHCRRLIDRPADRVYAGKCGAQTEDVVCQQDLYAILGAKVLKCPMCGTAWDVAERREWLLAEAEEVLATAVEISRAVSWLGAEPLTADRVRQWAARDRLVQRGHDRQQRPLYRVGDAIDLLSGSVKRGAA